MSHEKETQQQQPQKEGFWESQRTRVAVGGIILQLILLGGAGAAHYTGFEIPDAALGTASVSIAGIIWKWVDGRTKRNTAT